MERSMLVAFLLVVGASSMSVQWTDHIQCNLCKAAITELKVIDQDQNTKDLLQSIIQTWVCANLPIENCNEWMTGEIAKLHDTVQKMDATDTCSYLGPCGTEHVDFVKQVTAPETLEDTCSECKTIAGAMINILNNDEAYNLIKEAIADLCNVLPISDCASVDGYIYAVLTIIKNLDGETICRLLELC